MAEGTGQGHREPVRCGGPGSTQASDLAAERFRPPPACPSLGLSRVARTSRGAQLSRCAFSSLGFGLTVSGGPGIREVAMLGPEPLIPAPPERSMTGLGHATPGFPGPLLPPHPSPRILPSPRAQPACPGATVLCRHLQLFTWARNIQVRSSSLQSGMHAPSRPPGFGLPICFPFSPRTLGHPPPHFSPSSLPNHRAGARG